MFVMLPILPILPTLLRVYYTGSSTTVDGPSTVVFISPYPYFVLVHFTVLSNPITHFTMFVLGQELLSDIFTMFLVSMKLSINLLLSSNININ